MEEEFPLDQEFKSGGERQGACPGGGKKSTSLSEHKRKVRLSTIRHREKDLSKKEGSASRVSCKKGSEVMADVRGLNGAGAPAPRRLDEEYLSREDTESRGEDLTQGEKSLFNIPGSHAKNKTNLYERRENPAKREHWWSSASTEA